MKTFVAATCAVALAVLVLPASAWAQRVTETVDKTLPFPSGGTLKLNNFSGEVRITGGSGCNFVMKAVRRGYPDRLKEIQLTVESSGSTITVEANKRDRENMVETTFEIQMPSGAHLDINAFSSDSVIRDVEGRQQLKTFSGRGRDVQWRHARQAGRQRQGRGDVQQLQRIVRRCLPGDASPLVGASKHPR